MHTELNNIDDLLLPDQWINLCRIVQEAIGNIIKYYSASHVRVSIKRDDAGALTIKDDGVGFIPDATVNKKGRLGMGLRGMAERASLIGARFSIVSAPARGTTITIQIEAVTRITE